MNRADILLLDFNPASSLAHTLQSILQSHHHKETEIRHQRIQIQGPIAGESISSKKIADSNPDIICAILPQIDLNPALALLKPVIAQVPKTPVIVLTEAQETDELFKLLQAGAADFFAPPLRAFDVLPRILRLIDHTYRSDSTTQSIKAQLGLKQLVGRNAAFIEEINKIPVIAKCDASVLISGETGTGKELCARAIHYISPRSSKPFLPVNCGAIPPDLMENELFGHERGAFTDASTSHLGLIHEAEGGTLFLDEVDSIPPLAQVKLLRFLQDKEYRALGSSKTCKADVRVITATNANLEAAVAGGQLRKDFYYRLSTIQLSLPPLRERRDDIPLFVHAFSSKYAVEYKKKIETILPDALQMLLTYSWPGNVRELEHVIERAVIMSENSVIRKQDISLAGSENPKLREGFKEAKARIVAQFEKSYIQSLLLAFQGNITKAAEAANKNRRAFWQLIRKHQIDVQSFKSSTS
jgi:DNA-binding NtrC family response regulator